MASIFKYKKKLYSISDKNEQGEYILVKLKINKDESKEVEDVRVIPTDNKIKIKQILRNGNLNDYKKLEFKDEGNVISEQ